MIDYHNDTTLFRESLLYTEAETGFSAGLIEKDYFCTVILATLQELIEESSQNKDVGPLYFKGGTCLSKVHARFYRMSEDLDFTIPVSLNSSRSHRSRLIIPFKKMVAKAFLFSPKESIRLQKIEKRRKRKTPLRSKPNVSQQSNAKSDTRYGEQYSKDTYAQAIERACKKAGVLLGRQISYDIAPARKFVQGLVLKPHKPIWGIPTPKQRKYTLNWISKKPQSWRNSWYQHFFEAYPV